MAFTPVPTTQLNEFKVTSSDFREQYIADISDPLEEEKFVKENTVENAKKAFSRKRKLTFINLIIFITQRLNKSIHRELSSFYQKIKNTDQSIKEVTKSAFSHARAKLKWEAFKELNKKGINSFYKNAPYLKWNNFRLLAIDGTTLLLPNHPTIVKEFGVNNWGRRGDTPRSMAQASMLYDVLNFTVIDAGIDRYGTPEIDMAIDHFSSMIPGSDLVIMDRGYAGVPLMYKFKVSGIDFLIRMKDNWWIEVREMIDKGEKDKIVTFKLPKGEKELADKYSPEVEDIQCRLVIVQLPNGENEVLCTSILDNNKISYEDFANLYHLRWNIEEGYKFYKSRIRLEDFSGKTAHSIKQDFFAKVFTMTTMAVFAFPIEEKLKKEQLETKRKHKYKINRTNALSLIMEMSVSIFIKKMANKALEAFDKILRETMEIVRPNRKNPRKKRNKQPPSMNYKQL